MFRRYSYGSIPACAGKPPSRVVRALSRRVHPRVCGETRENLVAYLGEQGPSPRVRGNLRAEVDKTLSEGSIPACAGKPSRRDRRGPTSRVHPRVCGETQAHAGGRNRHQGPSPRVRGNRSFRPRPLRRTGSIPACAGKPATARSAASTFGVHPRVCGETVPSTIASSVSQGPSPRVRGNRVARQDGAGQPGVHPRVCGETSVSKNVNHRCAGPSPRVRGNRDPRAVARSGRGSIPACAGKPSTNGRSSGASRVHPRVCGETLNSSAAANAHWGPSPRVRGNPFRRGLDREIAGSIPACAGKPMRVTNWKHFPRVHPRVCGETNILAGFTPVTQGPSPRVRGNRPLVGSG